MFTNGKTYAIILASCAKKEKEKCFAYKKERNFDMNTENNNEAVLSEASAESAKPNKAWHAFKEKMRSFNGYYLIAAFIIPFMIMLAVYICLEKHPFGNQSVLTLDMQAQYVYYFEALRRLLTEGGSWLYSWERTLGGEMMGII